MVIAYMKGYLMNWRLVAWLCNIYTIVPVILVLLIPESPAWLVSKGKNEEAGKSLAWLYKYHPQPEHKVGTKAFPTFKQCIQWYHKGRYLVPFSFPPIKHKALFLLFLSVTKLFLLMFQSETLGELHLNALKKEHQQKLEEQARSSANNRTRKLKAFLKPTGYKPILLLIGLFFFQQFSGIYITLFYAVTFFKVHPSCCTTLTPETDAF